MTLSFSASFSHSAHLSRIIFRSIIGGYKALYGQEVPEKMVQLQKTKKEFEGHLTLVVFPFLKMSKKGPEQTAQEIGEYLKANDPALPTMQTEKGGCR